MDGSALGVLVQAGAVGISLALIWIIYQQNKSIAATNAKLTDVMQKISEDHRATIERNTDAWSKNTEALSKLIAITETRK